MNVFSVCSRTLGLISFLGICAACGRAPSPPSQAQERSVAQPSSLAPVSAPAPTAALAAIAVPVNKAVPSSVPTNPKRLDDALKVKRFVVATGVQNREPLMSSEPLPANGSAIYAFAELANPDGESENVRITFERKGGKERVGDVSLPVPAKATRHRTWAFTRNIFTAGVWEAVLWSERGAELSRTAFEVTPA